VDPPAGPVSGTAPGTIAGLLERFPIEAPPNGTAGAAVMILLREGTREIETLLIERTEREEDPASGQVAFPGGRADPSDASLLATVLRETDEEVGLGEADLAGTPHYVGTYHASRFGLDVGVFAAALGDRGRSPRPRSREEVAHVFWFPRSALGTTARVRRETPNGPIEVNAALYQGHVLWGFTRRLLRDFFALPSEAVPPSVLRSGRKPDATY
jgi:8-oxo-dGTP pyrophosphatase MutT (NUDIX family)